MKKIWIKIFLATLIFIFTNEASAVTYAEFIKDLGTLFFSTKGKATLFGYTQDFAFAEITEGNFSVGDMVVIKGKPDMAVSVPVELYEDAAYGEVESIKNKYIKIYIIKRIKTIPKEAIVSGFNKINIQIISNDNILPITTLLSREKDFIISERQDQKTLLKLYIQKIQENTFGYKVTLSANERILLLGNITITGTEPIITNEEKVSKPASILPPPHIGIVDTQNRNILGTFKTFTYDKKTQKFWIVNSDKQVIAYTFDGKKANTYNLMYNPVYIFAEAGKIYILDEKGKTNIIDDNSITTIEGFKIFGNTALFYPATKKISGNETMLFPDSVQYLYMLKNDMSVARTHDGIAILKNGIMQKSMSVSDDALIKITDEKIYIYKEEQEEVPLAGTYYKITLYEYAIENLTLTNTYVLSEPLKAFDVDTKTNELIYLKKDNTTKSIKL